MSLAGRAVLVTRPRELARGLAERIEAAGGRAVLFPAIAIEPLAHAAPDGRYDFVAFVSPSAVAQGTRWLAAGRAVALGAGTAAALSQRGVADVLHPPSGADSEALLALPELADVRGKRIAIVRGEGGRALLGEALSRRGAAVQYVQCYRRARPRADPAPLLAAGIDAVTVSSGEALENLLALLGADGARRLREAPLFVPHRRVAALAAQAGVREVVLAGPGDDEMIERLVAYFSHDRERSGR
jgi:uroporphyrinogen-III synthase